MNRKYKILTVIIFSMKQESDRLSPNTRIFLIYRVMGWDKCFLVNFSTKAMFIEFQIVKY